MEEEIAAPTLSHIVESDTLKWIFVGGKGGVGKTTVSCCLALQMALARPNQQILLISTDPAHNTSDAFAQKFGKDPVPVAGVANLHVMEVDATSSMDEITKKAAAAAKGGAAGGILGELMPDLEGIAGALPGIDEAMSFAEVMRNVKSMAYNVVIFDTAPTGHTLRLLGFPATLRKGLAKMISIKQRFGGLFSTMMRQFTGGADQEEAEEAMEHKLEDLLAVVEEITTQFKNPSLTTFVPVMIPEFLSLYETERLVQELAKFEMDVSAIVVNQLVQPDGVCKLCLARSKMQGKYLSQASDLYEDFHLVRLPLLEHEIRGVPELSEFGKNLLRPFDSQEEDKMN